MAIANVKTMYEQTPTVQPPGIKPQFPQKVSDIQNFIAVYGNSIDTRFDNTILSKSDTGMNIIKNSSEITFMPDRVPVKYTPVPPLVESFPNKSGANTMSPARRNDGFPPDNLPEMEEGTSVTEPEETLDDPEE